MAFHRTKLSLLIAASTALLATGCSSSNDPAPTPDPDPTPTAFVQPTTYAGFPITLAADQRVGIDHPGHSVSYAGQVARAVLRESTKAATKGVYEAGLVESYIKGTMGDDLVILAPASKEDFTFKEERHSDLGTNKQLYNKLYDADGDGFGDPIPGVLDNNKTFTLGMPDSMTSKDVIDLWIAQFEALNASTAAGDNAVHVDFVNGYDYNQLFPKYLMGAVFYHQTVDKYLDEFLKADAKQNNLPYKDNKYYTGKEHSWDEGFGWFGAAAHNGELTAEENYQINKKGKGDTTAAQASLLADKNGDGVVSIYTEYNNGPAYYASVFDRAGGPSTYGKDSMDAWLEGRTIIANAVDDNGEARALNATELEDVAALALTIQRNWEMIFAEAVYRYAGISHQRIEALELESNEANQKTYFKIWGELKGFMMALQYGGATSKINLAKFTEIDDLIGYGPVMEDGSQVTGITAGEYVKSAPDAAAFAAYKANLVTVQSTIDTFYSLNAKLETIQ